MYTPEDMSLYGWEPLVAPGYYPGTWYLCVHPFRISVRIRIGWIPLSLGWYPGTTRGLTPILSYSKFNVYSYYISNRVRINQAKNKVQKKKKKKKKIKVKKKKKNMNMNIKRSINW